MGFGGVVYCIVLFCFVLLLFCWLYVLLLGFWVVVVVCCFGWFCWSFSSILCFLLPFPSHIPGLGVFQDSFGALSWPKAQSEYIGEPYSSAGFAQLKGLDSVFPYFKHLPTGQTGLVSYPLPNSGCKEKFHPFLCASL